jgi:hypothetical protein
MRGQILNFIGDTRNITQSLGGISAALNISTEYLPIRQKDKSAHPFSIGREELLREAGRWPFARQLVRRICMLYVSDYHCLGWYEPPAACEGLW